MGNARGYLAVLALATASTAIALGVAGALGELAVRYRERHRTTVPGAMPALFYRHARLGHALVRSSDYYGWVHVNSDGFRGGELRRVKTPGTFRVLVLGGSTTFDSFVSADSMAWPARMQRWLETLVPDRRVEVINGGVPGYRVVDQSISLLTGLRRFEVDLVILYEGHNDLFGNLRSVLTEGPRSQDQTPDEVVTKTPWVHWLERHSLLYGKVVKKFDVWRFAALGRGRTGVKPMPDSLRPAAVDDGAARFQSDVSAFVAIAQVYGLKVVLASVTTISPPDANVPENPSIAAEWRNTVPFASPSVVLRGYATYRQALQRTAQQVNLPLIGAETFGIWGQRWYAPDDPIHFNDAGAACMGKRMAYALLSAGLLAQPTRTARAAFGSKPAPVGSERAGC